MKLLIAVTNLLDSSTASDVMKDDFRHQCQIILVALGLKFQERNPLSYCIAKNADSLSPSMMVASKETVVTRFEYTVTKMSKLKAMTPKFADNAIVEYDDFLIKDVNQYRDKFSSFDYLTYRLDEFLGGYLKGNPKYTNLWEVCNIFVISHGQAAVECSFNINKEMLVDNMKEASLVRLIMVYDEIKAFGVNLIIFRFQMG